jgi:Zn-dependent peptidase ImmA (M78 family)
MPSLSQQRRALQAADELLNDLGIDQEDPIDVFSIIQQLGLWLAFNPLNSLLGALVPKGVGGVMLTTQRAPSVQRYTAAHEIGHWVLDIDELALDAEGDIFYPSSDRERLAQLFAGQLLMPPPLVFATCSRHGIRSTSDATGPAVYLVARDMGASYEAAARQLSNLEIIDTSRRDYLLSLAPAKIKAELCHGHRAQGWVDVWPVDLSSNATDLQVTAGDEVCVTLPENRTTGYRWLTADELQDRAHRRRFPAPAPFAVHGLDADAGETQARSSKRVPPSKLSHALGRVPGNAGPRRTLPDQRESIGDGETSSSETAAGGPLEPAAVAVSAATELRCLEDRFEAGWAAVAPTQTRNVRRAIAGRTDVALPHSVDQHRAASRSELDGSDGTRSTTQRAQDLNTPAIPIAATGRRLIAFRSSGDGTSSINLSYTSAVDPEAPIEAAYALSVTISPPPEVEHRRRLLDIGWGETDMDLDELQPPGHGPGRDRS